MKIYIVTDLEGVAGVMGVDDYLWAASRYYEAARRLLTEEVNAAVRGFAAGGFDEIVVADLHGGGGMDIELLDPRARLMRGWPERWPFLLDETYDAIAFVGQHAKSGTPRAHIAHTQWWTYLDISVNGVSIGEYGQHVLTADELDIPVIFGSGDAAFCAEALAFTPWVETVSGKQGTTPGTGDDLDAEAYSHANESAIHMHPEVVRPMIEQGALKAAQRLAQKPESFGRVDIKPPYTMTVLYRGKQGQPPRQADHEHPSSVAALFNML